MGHYTQEEKEQLLENEEVRKRLLAFAQMSGREFFKNVQAHLSPIE